MTPPTDSAVRTQLVRAADLSVAELARLHQDGDSVLDHCLRRVVERAASDQPGRVAAFNAAPPRRN